MIKKIILFLFFCCSLFAIDVPKNYPFLIEKLVYFKDDDFKIFYGGPIDNGYGSSWMMPIIFDDENQKIRAVYELSFINCRPTDKDIKNVKLFFSRASDIDIKFKNILSKDYIEFDKLINNKNETFKGIVIREVDISNVYYPEIFISAIYSEFKKEDLKKIYNFLKFKYSINSKITNISDVSKKPTIRNVQLVQGLLEQKKIRTIINNKKYEFHLDHYYFKNDPWKSYYIITSREINNNNQSSYLLRLDSSCTSGQIYNDDSCDCMDQLFLGLKSMIESNEKNSLLIHIPAHDGRGFGTAPKAETEIYKRGGRGRVNYTTKLNTVKAAVLLYKSDNYDIRTYDGCARILKIYNIKEIDLLTDNKKKYNSMINNDIIVRRKNAHVDKVSCSDHLKAKLESEKYFHE